jgi:pimeloyl-ACP methyl ester carboxylesterase
MKNPGIRIDGIILITPWDTLQSIAGEKFPWLPVRMFLKDQYDSVGNLGNYRGNIVIVGAERDEVIPWWHAEALAKALPNTARTFTIKGAGHNDWPEMVDLAWWKEITDSARQNASP